MRWSVKLAAKGVRSDVVGVEVFLGEVLVWLGPTGLPSDMVEMGWTGVKCSRASPGGRAQGDEPITAFKKLEEPRPPLFRGVDLIMSDS